MKTIRFVKHTQNAVEPTKADSNSNGFDLYSTEVVSIKPGETKMVNTGISIELPNNVLAFVTPRSGLAAKYGISVTNSPGLIDTGYRGLIKVLMLNTSRNVYTVYEGDRIAQLVPMEQPEFIFEESSELSETERGEGGFGSTGK